MSLPPDLARRLVAAAKKNCRKAYAPFSRFRVGAAALTSGGRIFSGCNIENCSLGLTVCAERVAVFAAVAAGCRKISAVAVFADTPEPVLPCGACLQVLAEFGTDPVILLANGTTTERLRLSDLLPCRFRPSF
uniref:Cytidine deaminase n=1 Tax=candidate division WOR-3 bacterium TaxID=2052148 RepID=A0A7C4GCZ2_UNCW3